MSPEYDFDLTSVAELKPVPDGIYLLQVKSYDEGTSNTGNKKVTFCCEILKPDAQAADVKDVYIMFSLLPSALSMLKGFAVGCGIGPRFNLDDFLGKQVGGICAVEDTVEWGVRNKWNQWVPARGVVAKANRSQESVDQQVVENAMKSGSAQTSASDPSGSSSGGGEGITV